jgi:hypothetical protein
MARRPESDRFWEKVDKSGDCWLWTAAIMANGYGVFGVWREDLGRFSNTLAHRWAYTSLVGPIPAGMEIDHLCRRRNCIRVDHLEIVTHAQNQRRMSEAVTHCRKAGHEYTPENTYVNASGSRACLTCKRAATEKWDRENADHKNAQRRARNATRLHTRAQRSDAA